MPATHRLTTHAALLFVIAGCFGVMPGNRALAEIPRSPTRRDDGLQTVLNRIHVHASGDDWKKAGFRDEETEKWLDGVVSKIAQAANLPALKLPVHLSDVQPADAANALLIRSALITGKNVVFKTMVSPRDSIILADGAVDVDGVRGCVIIARGPVTVRSIAAYSVIVSGTHIKIGMFDGEPRNPDNGSLLLSRGSVQLSSGYGTVIVAPGGVSSGRPEIGLGRGDLRLHDGVLINTPLLVAARPAPPGAAGPAVKSMQIDELQLEPVPAHPLASKLEVIGTVRSAVSVPNPLGIAPPRTDNETTGAVFRFEGRRYVAEIGQPITDEAGISVAGLSHWLLSFADEKFLVFSSDDTDVVVKAETK